MKRETLLILIVVTVAIIAMQGSLLSAIKNFRLNIYKRRASQFEGVYYFDNPPETWQLGPADHRLHSNAYL